MKRIDSLFPFTLFRVDFGVTTHRLYGAGDDGEGPRGGGGCSDDGDGDGDGGGDGAGDGDDDDGSSYCSSQSIGQRSILCTTAINTALNVDIV